MAREIPALGRPFSLGMLYDCRNDSLVPGVSFLKREALEKDISIAAQDYTSVQVMGSDTTSDKSSALDMNLALKASFLCGLVQPGGSAKFLTDTKRSENQARVTLKYSRTTKFAQLSMKYLHADNVPDLKCDKMAATHIVTGILYGAQAFFIFDQEVNPTQNFSEVKGNLQAMVQNIPEQNIDQKMAAGVTCTFYGDFALQTNPVTYEDFTKVYSSLPKLLGENGEHAVPIKVWLYPLKRLDDKAAQLVRDISDSHFFEIEGMMRYMAEVDMQCHDLMKHPAAENFPVFKSRISQFKENCKRFTLMVQRQLAKTLPALRGGLRTEVAELAKVLRRKEESPFSERAVKDFLSKTRQEMDFVDALRNALPQIPVIPTMEKQRDFFIKENVDYTVCFNFFALSPVNRYLSDTSDWIHENILATGESYQYRFTPLWFEERGISRKARNYVKEFQAFAQVNAANRQTKFVISSTPERDITDISIYLFEEGELTNRDFKPPSKPHPPVITRKAHNAMELTLKPAEFGRQFIEGYKVEYTSDYRNWSSLPVQKAETIEVPDLNTNTRYQFRYSAVCKAGQSVVSDGTEAETLPASPPETLQTTAEPTSVRVTWKAPSVVHSEVPIMQYKLQYKEENSDTWLETKTAAKTESHVIEELRANTTYKIRVTAVCSDGVESEPSEEIQTTTPEESEKVCESSETVN